MRKDYECSLSCGCPFGGKHTGTLGQDTRQRSTPQGQQGFTHGNSMERHNNPIGSFLRAYLRPIARFARCLVHPTKNMEITSKD